MASSLYHYALGYRHRNLPGISTVFAEETVAASPSSHALSWSVR